MCNQDRWGIPKRNAVRAVPPWGAGCGAGRNDDFRLGMVVARGGAVARGGWRVRHVLALDIHVDPKRQTRGQSAAG